MSTRYLVTRVSPGAQSGVNAGGGAVSRAAGERRDEALVLFPVCPLLPAALVNKSSRTEDSSSISNMLCSQTLLRKALFVQIKGDLEGIHKELNNAVYRSENFLAMFSQCH